MSQKPQQYPPLFQIDVSAESPEQNHPAAPQSGDVSALLRQLVDGQQRQNELLEELTQQLNAHQRQRATELGQWKQANPELARRCRKAAEALGRVQNEFLERLTDDVYENADDFLGGDFLLNEFVDRYGPRLAHLNGVLQVLSQLSSVPNPTNTPQ